MKHVLVVDDDAALRIAMAEWIREDGFEVHTAENGAVALQEMRRFLPDVVVTDLTMPILNGWEFVKICRADPRLRRPPIVVISGTETLARTVTDLGARACLTKPFDIDVLLRLVKQLVCAPTS